jgi:hypothetical protein
VKDRWFGSERLRSQSELPIDIIYTNPRNGHRNRIPRPGNAPNLPRPRVTLHDRYLTPLPNLPPSLLLSINHNWYLMIMTQPARLVFDIV